MRLLSTLTATAFLAAATLPASAQASDDIWRVGTRIQVVADGHNEVWTAGALVSVRGAVGDKLYAAGAELDIRADVKGDAYVAGAIASVVGNYAHDLYVAGARVDIAAKIAGTLKAAGARVLVGPQTEVQGALRLAGADVVFSGVGHGGAKFYGDSVRIDGRIDGDVLVRARNVSVGPTAVITGNARFETLNDPEIAQGATIQGRQTVTMPQRQERSFKRVAEVLVATLLFGIAAGFVAGLVLLVVARPFVARAVGAARVAPWRSLLIGFAVLVLLPLAAVVLMATIVGLPIGLLSLLALPLLWLVATEIAAFAVGDWLLNRRQEDRSFGARLLLLLVGLVVLGVLGAIPVLGFLTWFGALILGLGAVWQGLRRGPGPIVAG